MASAYTIVKSGFQMGVENGASTKFWIDAWILDSPLHMFAEDKIPENDIQRPVNSYWIDGAWSWEELQPLIRSNIIANYVRFIWGMMNWLMIDPGWI